MKSTSVIRNLDPLGKIMIPTELRKAHGIKLHDSLEIYIEGDCIVLCKYNPGCIFCGETSNTAQFNGKLICEQCKQKLREIAQNNGSNKAGKF